MKETICWSKTGILSKRAVVMLCGWETKKGTITKLGERIAKTAWPELTPAAKNVLTRHGITE